MDLQSSETKTEEGIVGYAPAFRLIGSAIETFKVESFDLEVKNDGYWIRGYARESSHNGTVHERTNFFATWLRIRKRILPQQSGAAFEVHYTQDNLRELELKSRAQRGSVPAYPDSQSLPETLRCIGEFLDSKHASLSRLSMRGRWITLHYKSPKGHLVVEEHTATSLYSFWVSLCARRTSADKASLPSKGPKHFRLDGDEHAPD
jgi:hypothetical protein